MSEIDFKSLTDNELITYCKENNICYLNKQKKSYARKTLLSNIINKISNNQIETNIDIDIDAKLNNIIKSCHDKLYKASITGFKALNDIMNIFILVLLEYVFKSNPQKLEELIKIHNLKSKLNDIEIEEYKTYLFDINKFINKFDEKCDFTSIWRNYILFLASLFPSLYDKDDTKFNCKEERIITDVFKTIASLSNDINDKFIDDLAIKHGNIYEYFIGYCGKSENSKAFGQFFTPKPFINAILNDCGFKDMINNLEITNPTLYDPAMGSGGLLGLTYITCKDKINPNDIYGCEIEKDTMRYGESSILITTKIFNNNLIRCNTLDRNQNPYLRNNKKFDIIISNPPFGTKTNYKDLIPDEEIHNKKYIDDIYPIQTNGEKIFIQNIIHLLADEGICALILPDGELMTKNDTNKLVRKFIIDNCKIIKIIDVDNGVFKHTNIKTKVLILKKEKTLDYNYEIDYLNINKKYEVKLIQKFKLNEDYHLSIKTNYEDLIINNKDIEIKTLGEVCDFNIGGTPLRSKNEYYENGKNLWVSVRELNRGYIYDTKEKITDLGVKNSSVKLFVKDTILFSFKLSIGKTAIVGNPLYTNEAIAGFLSKNNDLLLNKYLYYYLSNNDFSKLSSGIIGNGSLNKKSLEQIQIPIPSIEIQEQVIKQIEDIDILINLRKNANENLKKEKEYLKKMINNKIINSNINEFGEIFDLIKGTIQSSKVEEDITSDIFFISKSEITDETRKIKYKYYNTNALYIAYAFNGNGKCPIRYYENKSIHSDLLYHIKPKKDLIDKINIIYIYYYLLNKKEYIEEKYQKGLAQKHLDVENFNKFKIYIPSLEIQEQFIKDIEELNIKFDKLKEDNDYIINNFEEYKKELFKF
jgi:type I restriction-modification system DNA methylase subunit